MRKKQQARTTAAAARRRRAPHVLRAPRPLPCSTTAHIPARDRQGASATASRLRRRRSRPAQSAITRCSSHLPAPRACNRGTVTIIPSMAKSSPVGKYIADLAFFEGNLRRVLDIKSPSTAKLALFRLKVKMVKAIYGINIEVVS